jgi:hypothetical protein
MARELMTTRGPVALIWGVRPALVVGPVVLLRQRVVTGAMR